MEKIRHYFQEAPFSCGPASLLIAYEALGIHFNEVSLAVEMGISQDGIDWSEMFDHVAAKLKPPAELKSNATYKDLQKDFKRGVIVVAWATDVGQQLDLHYSVVSGILKDMIELTDPGLPSSDWPSIMTKEDFMNKWGTYDEYPNSYLLLKPKIG